MRTTLRWSCSVRMQSTRSLSKPLYSTPSNVWYVPPSGVGKNVSTTASPLSPSNCIKEVPLLSLAREAWLDARSILQSFSPVFFPSPSVSFHQNQRVVIVGHSVHSAVPLGPMRYLSLLSGFDVSVAACRQLQTSQRLIRLRGRFSCEDVIQMRFSSAR